MRLIMTADEIGEPGGPGWDKWLAARRAGITASEIASVMGLDEAYGSPVSVFYAKRDGAVHETSDRMDLGRHCEPYILARFAAAHPEMQVRPGGLYSNTARPWQMATFDGLAGLAGLADGPPLAPVQAKTSSTFDGYGEDGTDELPAHYFVQAAWELDTGGFATAYVPVLFLLSGSLRTYVIRRDPDVDALIATMRAAAWGMLRRLARDAPPGPDAHPATTRALKRLYPGVEDRQVVIPKTLARRYRAAKAAQDDADARAARAENQIRARLGPAKTAVTADRDPVASRQVYPSRRVSVKILRERHPAIAAECTIASDTPVDKLVAARPKGGQP